MAPFLLHWLIMTVALWVTAYLLPGITVTSTASLLIGALILGFLNAFLRPVLVILTLPFTIMTLGLFYFVVNAIVFALASILVPGFVVEGFGSALLGAILVSLLSWLISGVTRPRRRQFP